MHPSPNNPKYHRFKQQQQQQQQQVQRPHHYAINLQLREENANFMVNKFFRSMSESDTTTTTANHLQHQQQVAPIQRRVSEIKSPTKFQNHQNQQQQPQKRPSVSSTVFNAAEYDRKYKNDYDHEDFEELLNCMICFDSFTNPKMLQCGHTFCEDCLIGYNRSYKQQKKHIKGQLPCPTCRELTKLDMEKGVSGLKNDFKIEKIKRMEDIFRTVDNRNKNRMDAASKRSNFYNCDSCKAERKLSKGVVFCKECDRKYCNDCCIKHERNALFNGHSIVNLSKDTDNDSGTLSNNNNNLCRTHNNEEIKFFCKTCRMVVCLVCTLKEHEGHNFVKLDSILNENRTKVINLEESICKKIVDLKGKLYDIDALKKHQLQSLKKAENDINETADKATVEISNLRQNLIRQLDMKRNEKLASVEQERENLQYLIAEASGLEHFVRHKIQQHQQQSSSAPGVVNSRKHNNNNNNNNQHPTTTVLVYEDLIERMKTISVMEVENTSSPYSYMEFKENHLPISLGELVETNAGTGTGSSGDSKREIIKQTPNIYHSQLNMSNNVGGGGGGGSGNVSGGGGNGNNNYKLSFKIDRQGSNLGELRDPLGVSFITITENENQNHNVVPTPTPTPPVKPPNGRTKFICVSEWGNCRLQIFDHKTGRHVCVLGMGEIQPQDVVSTRKGNLLITDAKNKRIQVFQPHFDKGNGKTISKWGLGKFVQPCGIAICPNGNCVVTDVAECSVSIFENEKTEMVRFGKNGNGQKEFRNPLYVAVNKANDIYVSDSDNHCVKIYDCLGNFKGKIGSKGIGPGQLLYPRGICIDDEKDILYVADRNNHRICSFKNGKFNGEILTRMDGIKSPYAVDILDNYLAVTESGEDRACLKVFVLQ